MEVDTVFCKVKYLLIYLLIAFDKCLANDILGCGGFVKSHVTLDYSKIEIGLYTKEGVLKEKTECAPTNGYYFLPLYEKGEYKLKVHPPAGWSFEPAQVDILVDGVSDYCSAGQDINFAFNGFGITGRVITAGQKQGPNGISVQLVDDKGNTRQTTTAANGDFHFTPVIPGKYTIKASHPRLKLNPSQALVQVKEGNTVLSEGALAVSGYDVTGEITLANSESPMPGLYVLLYSKEESPKYRVEGCQTALLQGVPDAPICYTVSDEAGQFTFGLVPAGEYRLLTLSRTPGQSVLSYNVKPSHVNFQVQHESLFIKKAFEVTGFTVIGSVVASLGGQALSGVRVTLGGTPAAVSDNSGRYTLSDLQAGVYKLGFKHEQCEFDNIELMITEKGAVSLGTARAARWRVCGDVRSGPTGATHGQRTLSVQRDADGHKLTVPHDEDGKWCTFLSPGVYTLSVDVSEQERRDGLQYYPLTQKVSVGHAPVSGVTFSQLKATLTGSISCLDESICDNLPVTLRPLSPEGGYVGKPTVTYSKKGQYSLSDVLPGSVEVSVPVGALCWQESRRNVAVTARAATVPTFSQAGYALSVLVTHRIQVDYECDKDRGTFDLEVGENEMCVKRAGRYRLTPRGCHKFEPAELYMHTSNDTPQRSSFKAVSHAVVVRVLSPRPDSVSLRVTSQGTATTVGPLDHKPHPDGGFVYEHTFYLKEDFHDCFCSLAMLEKRAEETLPQTKSYKELHIDHLSISLFLMGSRQPVQDLQGEVRVVTPECSSLLFTPGPEPQRLVGGADCRLDALTFRGRPALTLAGGLQPPVEGVTVTLTADGVKQTLRTAKDGLYTFGPLDASLRYTVTAHKESYVFTEPDDNGVILAHKLAEIVVSLVDDVDGRPLQGALVSVSGGSYRRNLVSSNDGQLSFSSLAPAEYYVKPLMKEYRFSPPHKILTVTAGLTHPFTLRGTRVSWSAVGAVVTVGGAGVRGVTVVALAAGSCSHEEATTESNGAFRIRGLVPDCSYTLQLKEAASGDLTGLKLVSPTLTLQVKEGKDIENIRLIAIQPQHTTDANVLIRTPNIEHYKSLKLKLALEASPHTYIFSTKLDPVGYSQFLNPGLIYVLPRLPADNKTYMLVLESTLSKSSHVYEEPMLVFNSDGHFKHFTIDFVPKLKSSEQELRQTSLLVVPVILALVWAWRQRDALLAHATQLVTTLVARAQTRQTAAPARAQLLDQASIHHILSQVNPPKKTPKKKTQ